MFNLAVLALAPTVSDVWAYIPAQPSNDSSVPPQGGLAPNQTDTSTIDLSWFPSKSTAEQVSYQLIGNLSTGLSQGALVHFDESNLTNSLDEFSSTPWIAFVACDANATNASQQDDIFTLAADRGAIAALLWSQWSNSCIINPEYADPANFNRLFDIFSTKKLVDAKFIESQYTNIANQYSNFDVSLLNASLSTVEQSITSGVAGEGYLIATLEAANATVQPAAPTGESPHSGTNHSSSQNGNPNTGLAMIILYAITGCVSALFCVVILSGAIRAIRNPERYGPRPDDPTMGPGRSRTAGLGRAILDTFPIIKFGAVANNDGSGRGNLPITVEPKRVSSDASGHAKEGSGVTTIEMYERERKEGVGAGVYDHSQDHEHDTEQGRERRASGSRLITDNLAPAPSSNSADSPSDEVNPEAIGHETCPICILDFEEGDDLRVLPCEGKHRFHQACVDPWLLEMSSSCPLCREDFWTLENMVADEHSHNSPSSSQRPGLIATPHNTEGSPTSSRRISLGLMGPRSSKYLRFAQRRRNRNRNQAVQQEEENRS